MPSFHLPQLYYFIAFATIMGWPALASGDSGWKMLANDVRDRICGNKRCVLIVYAWCEGLSCPPLIRRTMIHVAVSVVMGLSIKLFTWVQVILRKNTPDLELASRIHHPFLLSDNRHYTFYVWRRIFMLHPIMPYLLIPGYIVCAWIWFLRVGT